MLSSLAGTALVLIGGFWLADGNHLDGDATTLLLTALIALAAASWARPLLTTDNNNPN